MLCQLSYASIIGGELGHATSVRFELTRSKSNGLAIHRLNHSATMSRDVAHSILDLYPTTLALMDQYGDQLSYK